MNWITATIWLLSLLAVGVIFYYHGYQRGRLDEFVEWREEHDERQPR